MPDSPATVSGVTQEPAKLANLPAPIRWFREVLAILVWSFAFIQLLIFDVASELASRLPILEFVFRFRFLVLLGFIAVLWLALGNRRFRLFGGYVIAYPFVVVFWHLPRFLFQNWAVVVAFSPAVYSIFTTFRTSFVLFSAALISAFVVCLSHNRPFTIACMALLATYLGIHFVRRFRVAFSPSTVFADVSGTVRKAWEFVKNSEMAKRPEGLDPKSEEFKQKYGQNLLMIYMMTTGLYILGERLREVVNSRKLDLYFLGSLLYTFFLTSLIFALEYFGLERVIPGSFVGVSTPGLLDFIGLSFSTLMTSEISPLRAASGAAQVGLYLQLFGSLLIIVLLVFVVLTSIRERYRQDLDGVVSELRAASDRIGSLFEANYELTIAAAEAWLLEFNPAVVKWFVEHRHRGDHARQTATVIPVAEPDRPPDSVPPQF